jgi:hypothetical protein
MGATRHHRKGETFLAGTEAFFSIDQIKALSNGVLANKCFSVKDLTRRGDVPYTVQHGVLTWRGRGRRGRANSTEKERRKNSHTSFVN